LTIIKRQVASGELLVAEESSIFATVECQVSHEATRSVVHKDSLLGVGGSSIGTHIKYDVLKRSSLGNLPMNTSTDSDRHRSGVDDEVADLTVEIVLISVPEDF
jgi:hypothetical protein